MKHSIFTALLLLAFSCNANADNNKNDSCNKISGRWTGFYTLKNPEACKLAKGCTHLVAAEIQRINEDEFAIFIQPAMQKSGEMTFSCVNGNITRPADKVTLSCPSDQCFMRYDDDYVFGELMNH